jgi:FMN phosphatase YigB (HAD superfamily)
MKAKEVQMNQSETAFVLDFDGTVADTFTPSPSGVGVSEAYEYAIQEVFGEATLQHYLASGGLQNRSPRAVVESLQDFTTLQVGEVTEQLVELKVAHLLKHAWGQRLEDGALWPRLMPGFAKFWVRLCCRPEISRVILSSGHRRLIEETFEMNGLVQPHLVVSDDDVRRLPVPLSKPDTRLWEFMLARAAEVAMQFQRAVYIGDDPEKDGLLVKELPNVRFVLFGEGTETEGPRLWRMTDWRELKLPPVSLGFEAAE